MFSSSKSSSEAFDNRSLASDNGIAAGGNSGVVMRNIFGAKTFNMGGYSSGWKWAAVGMAAYILWQNRKVFKKFVRR